jgi:hypothetical protein
MARMQRTLGLRLGQARQIEWARGMVKQGVTELRTVASDSLTASVRFAAAISATGPHVLKRVLFIA